ncbi:MAG: nucleolar RNA-binding Nop10p family protein [Candidatus Micrarchaeota archaeon]|nr:RNA-protein complex protein Nop10 [Candidatus Micrarchaeota archaeon]MBU1681919.1 RNA-protein complex protein Nop10 [Candidatus Micrarchaeota archaeon]
MKKMRICTVCESYTLSLSHCQEKTSSAHPLRYNPNDKYAKYRRMAKCSKHS